jgi:hypothetical protein
MCNQVLANCILAWQKSLFSLIIIHVHASTTYTCKYCMRCWQKSFLERVINGELEGAQGRFPIRHESPARAHRDDWEWVRVYLIIIIHTKAVVKCQNEISIKLSSVALFSNFFYRFSFLCWDISFCLKKQYNQLWRCTLVQHQSCMMIISVIQINKLVSK